MVGKKEKNNKRDLDFEINFYEGLLKKNPAFVQALIALGDAYTKRRDFKKGLAVDLRLSRLRKDDPITHYNLACSYSLLNLLDDAFRALKKAIDLGYSDFHYLRLDPDLNNLRKDSRFPRLLKELAL
jgi:tetratricopeptide (TPR) repeat protein